MQIAHGEAVAPDQRVAQWIGLLEDVERGRLIPYGVWSQNRASPGPFGCGAQVG